MHRRLTVVTALLLVVAGAAPAGLATASATGEGPVGPATADEPPIHGTTATDDPVRPGSPTWTTHATPNRSTVHVVLERTADVDAVAAGAARHGTVLHRSPETAVLVVRTADTAALGDLDGVLRIEAGRAVDVGPPVTSGSAAGTAADRPSWYSAVGVGGARRLATANASVDVAVVDTGVDYTRPAFDETLVWGAETAGETTTYGLRAGSDVDGHGTAVAAYVGAESDAAGVTGVAPNADLYSVRTFGAGSGTVTDLVEALYVAKRGPDRVRGTADDAEVISLSVVSRNGTTMLERAVEDLHTDTVVVVAAGNDGDGDASTDEVAYPARYPETIAVGASDATNETAPFSSTGPAVDLVAPGTYLAGVDPDRYYSGTSYATPQVAGAAALLVAERGPLSTAEARRYLRAGATDIDADGPDDASGAGLLQVDASLRAAGAVVDGDVGTDDDAGGDGGTTNDGGGTDGDDGNTAAPPAVSLSLAATGTGTTAAESATVTFRVHNGGSDPATGLSTRLEALPEGWAVAGFDTNESTVTYDADDRAWRWAAPLDPGTTRTLSVAVAVPPDASPGDYELQAVATSGETSARTTVNLTVNDPPPPADRAPGPLTVNETNATVSRGGSVQVSATVRNDGDAELDPPRLSAASLPANWTVVEQSSDGSYLGQGREWFWLTPLDPGEERSVTATVAVPTDAATGTTTLRWLGIAGDERNATTSTVSVTDAPGGLTGPLDRIDRDGDGDIDGTEVQAAIAAFNAGGRLGGEPVDAATVQAAITAFNR